MEINVTKPTRALLQKLADSGFALNKSDGKWFIERVEQIKTDEGYSSDIKPATAADKTAAQAIVDAFVEPMPELDLQQLAYFLDTSSISDAAQALFNQTAPADLVARKKRASLKARYIQPRKCAEFEVFYNRVSQSAFKSELIAAYSAANPLLPPFAFTKKSLENLWLAAKSEDI